MIDEIMIEEKESFVQLLDTSYPLLKKLREEAPGTYKHSQALAAMIEGVSASLDLDINKMKVVALYHDYGKICNPKFFTENQLEDEDIHDSLDPWISAQLIRSHVSDTVNTLLNDKNFPREIIEIISQHHGTDIIQFFYDKSKEDDTSKFRYKGTRPKSVEAAILMITDHIEATSRSKYQAGKFEPKDIIETSIQKLIDAGQMDDVYMKLGDLKKIKLALAKELEGIYQKRVDYDLAKEDKETKE